MDNTLLPAFLGGIGILLFFIMVLRVNAFISLLLGSIAVGLFAGMPLSTIVENVLKGMGDTLGFVATIVGLGAIFGAILEYSGATEKLSHYMIKVFGIENSAFALSMSGFLIAIPVFFDVAFIILIPMIYALQKQTGRSLLFFAMPLLAGLAVAHSFVPPTPGPIAVADILNADLGWIIFFGTLVGLPTTLIAGLWFGKFVASKIHVEVPVIDHEKKESPATNLNPNIFLVISLILLPLIMILLNTVANAFYGNKTGEKELWLQWISFLGHPIVALLISTLVAMYFLGTRYGVTKEELQKISMRALGPAGIIILITGAGGVLKQMLVETGAGEMLAGQFRQYNLTPLIFAYIVALIVRVLQGSATVAMITAAGIMAPVVAELDIGDKSLALLVISIAAGSVGFSHVNDSGFWLVNRYLGLSEINTLKSWTALTGVISVVAIAIILLLNIFVS